MPALAGMMFYQAVVVEEKPFSQQPVALVTVFRQGDKF